VDGDVKLTKFLQKFVPHQPGFDESHRSFNTHLLIRKAFVQCWRFAFKAGILAPSNAGRERYQTLSHRCKPKGGAVMHAPDALCAKESI
jgi:hypothetical protein